MFEKIYASSNDIIPIMKCLCLKHSENYILESFKLPIPNFLIYKCLTPYNIGFLSNISNSDILYTHLNTTIFFNCIFIN